MNQTIRAISAVEAKIADHVWGAEELAALVEKCELAEIRSGALKRRRYKKRVAK